MLVKDVRKNIVEVLPQNVLTYIKCNIVMTKNSIYVKLGVILCLSLEAYKGFSKFIFLPSQSVRIKEKFRK